MLGQYLGDGHIASTRKGVFVLRVFSFSGYPQIVVECGNAIRSVMPASKVSFNPVPGVRLIIVTSHSKHWPCQFPQHGPGRKHERPIRLRQWQAEIVQDHPEAFLRGLVHSDGCRVINRVKTYEYARYFFSNASDDIRRLFTDSCDRLGIAWKQSNQRVISIAQKGAVAEMDTFIGPKS